MSRASDIRSKPGSRWVHAAASTLAIAACAAHAQAQHGLPADAGEPAEPVLLALGPTVEAADAARPRGALSLDVRPSLPAPGLAPQSTDIGLQWRQPLGGNNRVDITAWRRSSPPVDALSLIQQREPVYGARFEFKLPSSSSRLASDLRDLRFIGLQLDNGARLGIRRSNGHATLYYRMQF